jgi:hypothetical protein
MTIQPGFGAPADLVLAPAVGRERSSSVRTAVRRTPLASRPRNAYSRSHRAQPWLVSEDTMTAVHAPAPIAPPHMLSLASHLGLAIGVVVLVSLCWRYAEDASHQAVQSASEAFSATLTHVTLPSVQIVGRRGHAALPAGEAGATV